MDEDEKDCARLDFGCHTSNALGGVTDDLENQVKEILEIVVQGAFTGWMNIPMVGISGDFGPVSFLRENLSVLVSLMLTLAIVGFGIAMILAPRKETFEKGSKYGLRIIAVFVGSITIASLAVLIAEGYSTWIIDQATLGDGLAEAILNAFQLAGPIAFLGALFFGGFAAIFSVIQGGLLIIRNIFVPMLIGGAPVAVVASTTEIGNTWWTKYLGWFIAYLLYKPVAATIYAVSFWMLSQGNVLGSETTDEAVIAGMSFMYGLAVMALAIFCFRAMMTVVNPIVGKMTSGGGGAAMVAMSVAALAAGGAINKGVSMVSQGASQAAQNISPSNAAAGGTPGGSGSQGPAGPSGGSGSSGGGSSTSGGSGWGNITPSGQGGKLATDAMSRTQQGVSDSITNDKDEN